jgi:hypothetical protein
MWRIENSEEMEAGKLLDLQGGGHHRREQNKSYWQRMQGGKELTQRKRRQEELRNCIFIVRNQKDRKPA